MVDTPFDDRALRDVGLQSVAPTPVWPQACEPAFPETAEGLGREAVRPPVRTPVLGSEGAIP